MLLSARGHDMSCPYVMRVHRRVFAIQRAGREGLWRERFWRTLVGLLLA
jgi:hypothetical protein